jgi:hypothetical protein
VTQLSPLELPSLTRFAAAAATCADRYAKVFYPMIRDADEKYVCCVYGAEAMKHHQQAVELLRAEGVELAGLVERPISERGLPGSEGLEALAADGLETWPARAAFSALVERAMGFQLRRLARSEHAPLAAMAGAALPRQEKHAAHGLWLLGKHCAGEPGEAQAQAQQAIARLWPLACGLAGDDARPAFLDALRPALEPLGLALPA